MKKIYGTTYKNLSLEEGRRIVESTNAVKVPLQIVNPFTKKIEEVNGFTSLVREFGKQDTIAVVSDKNFALVNNVDVFDDVVKGLQSTGLDFQLNSIKINNFKKHNKIQMLFTFPELSNNIHKSNVDYGFAITNSSDGSLKYSESLEAIRMVCTNGMTISNELAMESFKHTNSIFERFMTNFDEKLEKLSAKSKTFSDKVNTALEYKINDMLIKNLVKAGFPLRLLKNIDEIYEKYNTLYREQVIATGTLYALYQVLTNWVSNYVAINNLRHAQNYNNVLYNLIEKPKQYTEYSVIA